MVERLVAYTSEPGANGAARTLLLTTHQAELARPLARTTITLSAGKIATVDGELAAVQP
jgi:ABC-type thiamine transport system ATPase subunit